MRNFAGYAAATANTSLGYDAVSGRLNLVVGNLPVMTFNATSVMTYYQLRPSADNQIALGGVSWRWAHVHGARFCTGPGSAVIIQGGNGDPEGVVTASVGSLWLRANGAAGTTFYVKESGTGNTGWVAK